MSMASASPVVRSLLIYGICLPLAVVLGYFVAQPLDYTTMGVFGLVLFFLAVPLLLRWHHFWLVAMWNSIMFLAFLPGHPPLWMFMTAISLCISVIQYILNRRIKFLSVPSVSRPLIFLLAVVLATAKLRGGIALQALGGGAAGGKRYLDIMFAVAGYFALTSRSIPPRRAWLCVAVFFLALISNAVGEMAPFVPRAFYPMFYLFPVNFGSAAMAMGGATPEITRASGVSNLSYGLACLMLARYGVRGIFSWRSLGRQLVFAALAIGAVFGGYRSILLLFLMTFGTVMYLEGLWTSRRLPLLVLGGVLGAALLVLFANRMPLNIQRSLSVLPGLDLNPIATQSAQVSSDWRLEMWRDVLPEVPQYLILGKGLVFKESEAAAAQIEGGLAGTEVAGDYHNGPLSVIIPFGLFGVAGFAWFIVAAWKVLRRNCRYGDPSLLNINRLLFAYFVAKVFLFLFVVGGFSGNLQEMIGIVALGISLNGGVAARPIMARTRAAPDRAKLKPLLQRPVVA